VVHHRHLDARTVPEWNIAATPSLRIGSVAGPPNENLFRVTHALQLRNGNFLIAQADGLLRLYGPDGSYKSSVGRRGDGPGEFQNIEWLQELNDGWFAAYDGRLRRLTILTGDAVERLISLAGSGAITFPIPFGVLPDNSILATASPAAPSGGDLVGRIAPEELLMRYPADGTQPAILWRTPGKEVSNTVVNGRLVSLPAVFGRDARISLHGDHLYVAWTGTPEVVRLSSEGGPTLVLRWQHDAVPVEDTDVAAFIAAMLDGESNAAARLRVEQMLLSSPLPDQMPALGELVVDELGNVWVQDFPEPKQVNGTWRVFDTDGLHVANISIPTGLRILQIGAEFVLGLTRDELDVEYVLLYDLRKHGT
jgi:hypothetical protein